MYQLELLAAYNPQYISESFMPAPIVLQLSWRRIMICFKHEVLAAHGSGKMHELIG